MPTRENAGSSRSSTGLTLIATPGSPWGGSIPQSQSCPGLIPRLSGDARLPRHNSLRPSVCSNGSPPCAPPCSTSSPSPQFAPPPLGRSIPFHTDPRRSAPLSGSWPIPSFRSASFSRGEPDRRQRRPIGRQVKSWSERSPGTCRRGCRRAWRRSLTETSDGAELAAHADRSGLARGQPPAVGGDSGQAEIARRWAVRSPG